MVSEGLVPPRESAAIAAATAAHATTAAAAAIVTPGLHCRLGAPTRVAIGCIANRSSKQLGWLGIQICQLCCHACHLHGSKGLVGFHVLHKLTCTVICSFVPFEVICREWAALLHHHST